MKELKKCPFCGYKAKVMGNYSIKNDSFYIFVQCLKCGARGKTYTGEEIEKEGNESKASLKAIEAWNTRTEEAPPFIDDNT